MYKMSGHVTGTLFKSFKHPLLDVLLIILLVILLVLFTHTLFLKETPLESENVVQARQQEQHIVLS